MKKIIGVVLVIFSLYSAEMSGQVKKIQDVMQSRSASSKIHDESSSSSQLSSLTVVMFPIIAALLAPENKFIPVNSQWTGINLEQRIFLQNFFSRKEELRNFNSKEIRAWASNDYNVLNRIARENGFDIQLNKFGPDEFGSLAIFDVLIEWLKKGSLTSICYEDKDYRAAELTNNFNVYEVNKNIHSYPIIEIRTKSKDKVYMTIAGSNHKLNSFNLIETINNLRQIIRHVGSDGSCKLVNYYDSIIFPCIDLNQQVNISWLLGMQSNGFFVAQALQQTKFKMDEKGAHVQSAVMVSMLECCISPQLKIDKPFYIWIERENCSIPIFMGYIDSSDWVKA